MTSKFVMKKVNDNAKVSNSAKAKASLEKSGNSSDSAASVDSATSIHGENSSDMSLTPDALESDLSMSGSALSDSSLPETPASEAEVADNASSQDETTAASSQTASSTTPQTVKPRARRTRSSSKSGSAGTSSASVSSEGTDANRKALGSVGRPPARSQPARSQSKVTATADSEGSVYSSMGTSSTFRNGSDQFRGVAENPGRLPNRSPGFQAYQPGQHSSDRIAIFIDGSNLFYAASHLNIEVDYRRLLTTLVRGRRLLRAYFYTGVDPQNEKQRGFLLWLNRHGHRVVSKELAHMPDGSRKANMHVEMAVDMMRIAEYCSTLTLLGGDGNLAYALQVLSQRGTSIEVVSLQSMTSDSLIDLADSYTDLADLRNEIKR
ncbi:MAG: NYN domain-containing protein [Cyanobacteria bacterium J06598_3]